MARQYQLKKEIRTSMSGIDYEAELNEQQYAAVTAKPGPALVIAGAGSGKTRTLTFRVAWLLDQGVEPRSLLLLTFTNKAAREMKERVSDLVPQDLSEMWAGTFHSIGSRILRRHAEEMGLTRSFSIMDRDDQKSVINAVVQGLDIDTKSRRFPKADVLISMISMVVNTTIELDELIEKKYPYFEEWAEEIAQVMEKYTEKKLETNSVDFDDLLTLPLELLKENDELRALYQKRFEFVLVDEYQDTNHIQSELVGILAQPQESVMVVGDDAQSIYSWRGADMDHILSFPKRYPEATVYKIETNYRSVPEVLNLSNAAIRANKRQFTKTLEAKREGGAMTPALVPLEDPRMQAKFIAQRILELRDEEGVELEEMAILYRAHHQSLEVQMELTSRGIPFEITSGLRFFEQAHIKDVAAFIRFIVNRRDEISFKRFALMLSGVGGVSADKLWRQWLATGLADQEELPESFAEHFQKFKVPKKAEQDWHQIGHILDEMAPKGSFAKPAEMIISVLEGFYREYAQETFENYESRQQDIEQLIIYAQGYQDILELLEQLSLMGAVDGEPSGDQQEKDGEKITLSSIHQAKGLEWKVVFVIWLTDGMFPNGRVLESGDETQLEEERRLFYVALTRAKDELYLTYPQLNPKSYTGETIQQPSRFLRECPGEMMEMWEVGSAW